MTERVAIFGATSAIAQAVARCYAAEGCQFFLAGRDETHTRAVADDLLVRGAQSVVTAACDLADSAQHERLMLEMQAALSTVDVVLLAYGTLTDQPAAERDPMLAVREVNTNFISPLSLLTYLANFFDAQGTGTIAVIGSVAGDRGRRTNYVYGSAKAGLAALVGGLRHRLGPRGVGVVLIKPGFVATPMTSHLAKGGPMWATPERVAADIRSGIARNRAVVYTPWFWRWIMLVIRMLPDAIFRRLNI